MFAGLLSRKRPGGAAAAVDTDDQRRLRGAVYCAALDVRRAAVGVQEARALELLGLAMENLKEVAGKIGTPEEATDIGTWARDLVATAKAARRRQQPPPQTRPTAGTTVATA